jgi:uncharacterized RDD family membrane protein YckC
MSRSFRGRSGPEEDDPTQYTAQEDSAQAEYQQGQGINFDKMHKYGADEQLAVEPVQTDIGKRLVAGLIDVAVAYLFQIVINCIPYVNLVLGGFLPMVGFLIVRDALFNGRGIGKNLMGLQVVDLKTGQPASFVQSIKRNIVVFGPYMTLFIVNMLLRIMPNDMVSSVVTTVVIGAGQIYTLAVIPYEAWRVYSRPDGLRWGDQFAGTSLVPADTDFSNPLSK